MSVQHDSLDILHVGVVLESTSIKTHLLAHLGDLLAVVLGEYVEFENSLSDVWSGHEVDFENFGLEVTLVLSVSFKSFQEESSALLEFVELKEHVNNLINLSLWWSVVSVGNHFSKSNSGLGVDWHDLSKNADEIWDMASLLAVRHDLVKLICFNQTLDDLIRTSRLLINVESQLWIGSSNEISKLVGHCKFTFLDPVLDQVQLVLCDDWSSQLDGFDGIQLCCLQKSVKIDQNWSWSSSLRKILENINGVLVSQKSAWSISCDVCGTSIISRSNFGVEKLLEHFVSTR